MSYEVRRNDDFTDLPDLCKRSEEYTRIRNVLLEIGALPTSQRRQCIHIGMSEAYRRNHVKILGLFFRVGHSGARSRGQSLARYIVETAVGWYGCAQQGDFEYGLSILRAAAREAGFNTKFFERERWRRYNLRV